MDVWVALVDALHRGGLVAAFQATDEVAKDVSPVDDADDRLTNLFAEMTGDVAPAIGLRVCLADGLLDDVGDLALHLLAKFFWDLFPARVVVHRVQPILTTGARGCILIVVVATLTVVLILLGALLFILFISGLVSLIRII